MSKIDLDEEDTPEVFRALRDAEPKGEWQSKMKSRPYCPCCHHFDHHGPACPISGGMLSGQPITN